MKTLWTMLALLVSAPACSEPAIGAMDAGSGNVSDSDGPLEPPPYVACTQSLDAWCSTLPSNQGCIRDWVTALPSAFGRVCTGLGTHPDEVEVCGPYNVLASAGTDIETDEYYDGTSGTLMAVITVVGGAPICVAGPANFVPPTCSTLTRLCDLMLDSGVDAGAVGSDAANSGDSATE
jgi:hypothetical protein